MASPPSRKRKSPDRDYDAHNDGSRTPTSGPPKKRLRITQSQKQALIDNLQLEITERARKLRAHYALQAQDLRGRIERRVNRIPVALRKANMGELFEKTKAGSKIEQEGPSLKKPAPSRTANNTTTISEDARYPTISAAKTQPRSVKRPSDAGLYSDKENAPAAIDKHDMIEVPKKRGNPNAMSGPSRAISQTMRADAKILSPKSSNSRTYPVSPLKGSPEKHHLSYMSRPASPLKPSSPIKTATGALAGMVENARARATRGAALKEAKPASQAKKATTRPGTKATTAALRSPVRPATRQQDRHVSSGTTSSNASSGTTIVRSTRTGTGTKKAGTTTATKKPTLGRSQAATATSAAKKTTAASRKAGTTTPAAEPPTTGRRVLRKRV